MVKAPEKELSFDKADDLKVSILNSSRVSVNIDFRDWKWLTQFKRFTSEVTDPHVLLGEKEGTIEIDFNQMTESDAAGHSTYLVAGRMFFEAHVFGYALSSFTNSGFVDKEGYEIPYLKSSFMHAIGQESLWFLLFIGIMTGLSKICKSGAKMKSD